MRSFTHQRYSELNSSKNTAIVDDEPQLPHIAKDANSDAYQDFAKMYSPMVASSSKKKFPEQQSKDSIQSYMLKTSENFPKKLPPKSPHSYAKTTVATSLLQAPEDDRIRADGLDSQTLN